MRILTAVLVLLLAAGANAADNAVVKDAAAETLLKAAAAKLQAMRSLKVEAMTYPAAVEQMPFQAGFIVTLERPNRFRYEQKTGKEGFEVVNLSDGQKVWNLDRRQYIAYQQPVRPENSHLGVTPLIQYFFKAGLGFDSTDPFWGNAVSLFDTNKNAYDKFVSTQYLGEKSVEGMQMKLVRVRYNSRTQQMQHVFYLRDELIMAIVSTSANGDARTIKYRNYQANATLPASTFAYVAPKNFPIQQSDPVRLGQPAPDFELPLEKGGTVKLKDLLVGKRGLLVTALDGSRGIENEGPDAYLAHMRLIQSIKDKYASQGLEVIAVVGGKYITPDVTTEMMRNWMPDTSRFNYAIAIDVDLERGIQGSAYQNFQLGGRNNTLIDSRGRVVFACTDFDSKRVNELALYQALSQIGFSVSPAELDGLIAR